MRLTFFSEAGTRLASREVMADDHMDACEIGHEILAEGTIPGADDFQVDEIHKNKGLHGSVNVPYKERLAA